MPHSGETSPFLPIGSDGSPPRQRFLSRRNVGFAACGIAAVAAVGALSGFGHWQADPAPTVPALPLCAQSAAVAPSGNASWIDRFSSDRKYILAASERLAGAVRIPTESYDSTRGVPPPPFPDPDPIHDGFPKLHKYLQDAFPLVHATLKRVVIQRYALLYTWEGSDPSLAPLVLMSHMDTVPVLPDTLSQWIHPPFSGLIDEENDAIWGRGSVDTKPTLVGSLEAVEVLLSNGFVPRKTIYLAFGYDEEIAGREGARYVGQYMEEELELVGKVGLVVDEGLDSLTSVDGLNLAVVNTAEKGYLDYHIEVQTPGGHSSIPPLHTGIGLMSQLVNALESHPFDVLLTKTNPYLGTVACKAEHSPDPDSFVRSALQNFDVKSKELAAYLAALSLNDRYRMASSQAIDIINGGLKVNALPERVTVDLNNRISIDSSIAEFQEIVLVNLLPVATEFNLNFTFQDFLHPETLLGSRNASNAVGSVRVYKNPTDSPLEPSPVSPTSSAAWNMFEGTIHHVYERPVDGVAKRWIVSPGLMAGNTDTRYHWKMSENILRFSPAMGGLGYHTVNERASIKGYMLAVTFFHELIRNYDEL